MAANREGKAVGAEIPTLKKKDEKEKRGGAVIAGQGSGGGGGILYRWLGLGVRPGGQALSGLGQASLGAGRVAVGAGARLGLMPNLVNFLASNAAMALLTAALTGGAVYTLYTLGMSATDAQSKGTSGLFPAAQESGSRETSPEPYLSDNSSLNYFMTANQGQGLEESKDAAAQGQAGETVLEEVPEPEGKGADTAGKGAELAADLVSGQPGAKLVAAKSFGKARDMGAGNGLAGGAGMAGGSGRQFEKIPTGQLSAPEKRGKKLAAKRGMASTSRVGGRQALDQLKFTNKRSVRSLGMTSSEGRAFEAAEAFTSGPRSGGGAIGSAGMGSGGSGLSGGANQYEGPIQRSFNGEEKAPRIGKSKDKSPWTKDVMLAMALLMTASTIITIIGILALLKHMPVIGPILTGIQLMLYIAATAMAATATALGVMIMTKHKQQLQGAILTTGGAITTSVAGLSLAFPQSMPSWASVLGGIAGMAAAVAALLAANQGGGK